MKFALIQNTYCPGMAPDWYRKISDLTELDDHQTVHARQYFVKSFEDPHFEAALQKGDVRACVIHPMNILPKRAQAMIRAILREGTIYLNRVGGWMFLTPSLTVLEEIEADQFPTKSLDFGQYVYIHKWPLGNHYYVIGWPKTLLFKSEKFNTLEEAAAEAKQHVPASKIFFKPPPGSTEKFVYPTEGD